VKGLDPLRDRHGEVNEGSEFQSFEGELGFRVWGSGSRVDGRGGG
jgi:hypothetical protein